MRPDGSRASRYLRTSPEFACKKLLAAGETRIFEFARVFRDRERGDLHLPEFTMLEWYRAGAAYDAIMADSVVVIARAAQATGIGRFSFRGRTADPFAEPELLTVAGAFDRFAGIDLLATIAGGEGDRAALAAGGRRQGPGGRGRHLVRYLQQGPGRACRAASGAGAFDHSVRIPVSGGGAGAGQAVDPRVAERFEVYACGVELANGFGELTDADEQRKRFTQAMDGEAAPLRRAYPLDEDFLAAVAAMPEASGVALGFDRLVMLASGASRIDQVVWTPPAE